MRIGTNQLIIKALHAVEEAVWSAQKAPVAPTFALRFALAFLYAHGDGRRDSFDKFWRIVTDASDFSQPSLGLANTVRGALANTEAYAIYRAVGVYRSTEMMFFPALHKRKATARE